MPYRTQIDTLFSHLNFTAIVTAGMVFEAYRCFNNSRRRRGKVGNSSTEQTERFAGNFSVSFRRYAHVRRLDAFSISIDYVFYENPAMPDSVKAMCSRPNYSLVRPVHVFFLPETRIASLRFIIILLRFNLLVARRQVQYNKVFSLRYYPFFFS